MKKSKVLVAALAATMFATAACGLVACDKDAGDLGSVGKTYTVTFNADGGTLKGATTLKTNADGIVQGQVPTAEKADNTFKGWTLTKGETTTINFTTQAFTSNRTVYAVYTPVVAGEEYTITFEYGIGTGAPASAQTVNGKLTSLPTPVAPSGKKFDGWFTSATGGSQVSTATTFTQSGAIYAQYSDEGVEPPQPTGDGAQLLVNGQFKLELTDNTPFIQAPPEGATATYEYYATGVQLSAGDVVTFSVNGTVLAHHSTPAEGPRLFDTSSRHGATWNQATGAFTVKSNSTGVFSIYLRYYDTGEGNDEHPCWSIEFFDGGVDQLVPGGLYLVGEGFANASWAPSTDCYIDPDEGLTITLKQGDSFKTCHSDSAGTGTVWDMGDNTKYKEVNGTYLNFSTLDSGMGNASVTSGTHTYLITYEDGMVVFTCID
ncbi:MAG: InlB B-repeat-containing protein [Clostridiales bacterium]|nr:InlB B-repeat-containing protein [Clostridiales bacterium]